MANKFFIKRSEITRRATESTRIIVFFYNNRILRIVNKKFDLIAHINIKRLTNTNGNN